MPEPITKTKSVLNSKKEFLVDTDILVDHLVNGSDKKSPLECAMESGICYTTVVNSSEVYFAVETDEEKLAVDLLMRAVKVLGLHSRYSLSVHNFSKKVNSVRDAIICATAKINKLPILTFNKHRYSAAGLVILEPKDI